MHKKNTRLDCCSKHFHSFFCCILLYFFLFLLYSSASACYFFGIAFIFIQFIKNHARSLCICIQNSERMVFFIFFKIKSKSQSEWVYTTTTADALLLILPLSRQKAKKRESSNIKKKVFLGWIQQWTAVAKKRVGMHICVRCNAHLNLAFLYVHLYSIWLFNSLLFLVFFCGEIVKALFFLCQCHCY